jgi:hypothetical protein
VALTLDPIASARALSLTTLRRRHANASPVEQQALLSALWHGTTHRQPVGEALNTPPHAAANRDALQTPLDALLQVIEQLERLGIVYLLGGSWASWLGVLNVQGDALDQPYLDR